MRKCATERYSVHGCGAREVWTNGTMGRQEARYLSIDLEREDTRCDEPPSHIKSRAHNLQQDGSYLCVGSFR